MIDRLFFFFKRNNNNITAVIVQILMRDIDHLDFLENIPSLQFYRADRLTDAGVKGTKLKVTATEEPLGLIPMYVPWRGTRIWPKPQPIGKVLTTEIISEALSKRKLGHSLLRVRNTNIFHFWLFLYFGPEFVGVFQSLWRVV